MLHRYKNVLRNKDNKGFLNPLLSLREVILYVYNRFLSKPYAPEYVALFPKASELGYGKHIVYRPNHNLAHTLRCAFLVPKVAEYYASFARHKERYRFSNDDIKKMQIAMLFFVVGRENEMGFADNPALFSHFRNQSAKAFKEYCLKYQMSLFKTKKEVERYANIIADYHNKANSDPVAKIMKQAHCLDLVRCFSEADFATKCREEIVNDFTRFEKIPSKQVKAREFASMKVDELIAYAAQLLQATGTRINDGIYKSHCDFKQFERCSKEPDYCLKALNEAIAPFSQKIGLRV